MKTKMHCDSWTSELFLHWLNPWRMVLLATGLAWMWDSTLCLAVLGAMLCLHWYFVSSYRSAIPYDTPHYGHSYVEWHGSLPMLHLNENSHYEQGYAAGSIYGSSTRHIVHKLKRFAPPPPAGLYRCLPKSLRHEFDGLADATGLKVDDLLRAHMMANRSLGCTTLVNHQGMGRNLDWMPFDLVQNTIVIRNAITRSCTLTLPGLICGPTMWNDRIAAAVNVLPQPVVLNPEGLPTLFHFRVQFERPDDAQLPWRAYHMTVWDAHTNALTQSIEWGHSVRRTLPLVVLNVNAQTGASSLLSKRRWSNLLRANFGLDSDLWLALQRTQTWMTCHALVFTPTHVAIAFANGYAASEPTCAVLTRQDRPPQAPQRTRPFHPETE